MRSIELDALGTARFRKNTIVAWLVENGHVSLNSIIENSPKGGWPQEDIEEFWQMLGYSVSGYGDLSFIRPETVEAADKIVENLINHVETPPLISQEEAFQRAVKAGMWDGLVSKPED